LAIEMAQLFQAEIINFDSLLFYKELQIGVAKPTLPERMLIPHHLIDVTTIDRPWDASIFRKECLKILQTACSINEFAGCKHFILVGGSGFYLRALTEGMYPSTTVTPEIRAKSDQLYQLRGIDPFWEILGKHDLTSQMKLKYNDHYRIRRAVEHWWGHQTPFSTAQQIWESQKELSSWKNKIPIPFDFIHLYLDVPKDEHWNIILKRTQQMLNQGLLEETQELLKTYQGNERPLQSIGYKETIEYLQADPKKDQIAELIEAISVSTRQLAKSQRTWFKKMEKESFHPLLNREKIKDYLSHFFYKDK